ncbi:hypothetical protein CYMTET_21034 [Cymbomonas tetramitiformis]|uniref:Thioredoxin domain-containing protein n=1 Tax=Cymbomonas tetramitiformis TaxID=36881 RepID=A0AAE0L3D8_9CHLO|nr:hypothetical protein CYMTET_21034 [Cymbomonas tetramitiformis]
MFLESAPFINQQMLLTWEKSSFSSLMVVIVVKLLRAQTMDAFMSDVFMFSKTVIVFLCYIVDMRLFSWYMILFTVLFLLLSQPFYDGPENIMYFTPPAFDDHVRAADPSVRWLVEFYVTWSPSCVHLEPIISELSLKYSSEKLQFGKMDLGRWPLMAKELNVSMKGTSPQLPTLIMFEGGKEICRIPHVFSDGSVAKGRYRKRDLIRGFDLDNATYKGKTTTVEKKNEKTKTSAKKTK